MKSKCEKAAKVIVTANDPREVELVEQGFAMGLNALLRYAKRLNENEESGAGYPWAIRAEFVERLEEWVKGVK